MLSNLIKRLILLGALIAPNIAFAQTCIGTPPLTQIVVDNTINICLPTNNANEISALALRQVLQTMTSAIFANSPVIISGIPTVGQVPIATGPITAVWGTVFPNLLTFDGGVAISPTPTSIMQGFNVAQSGPNSGITSTTINYNNIFVNGDDHNNANNISNGLNIEYGFGGANFQGAIQGLNVYTHLNNTGNASNPNPFYTAINAHFEAFNPDTSSSAIVTHNVFTLLEAGAIGYHSIEGGETAVGMVSSGGAQFRVGWNLAAIGNFQGSSSDAALIIGAGGSPWSAPWFNGLLFSHFNGAAPLDSTNGCIICTDGSSDTIKTGIDLSAYTITGNFLKGPGGFLVDGTGTLQAKTAFVYGPPTGGPAAVVVSNQDGVNTSELIFEAAGVPKWEFGKNGSGNFFIFDDVGGQNVIASTANGALSITPVGATNIGSSGVRVNIAGQLVSTAGLPTIASGACGTTTNGAVVAGSTNQSGNITIGAAGTTTCTISWSGTLPVAPNACVFFPANAAAAAVGTTIAFVTPPTTSHVVLNGSALANANYSYVCL